MLANDLARDDPADQFWQAVAKNPDDPPELEPPKFATASMKVGKEGCSATATSLASMLCADARVVVT